MNQETPFFEMDELLELFLEGEATPEQILRLNELLEQDEAQTRTALARLQEHRLLSLHFQNDDGSAAALKILQQIQVGHDQQVGKIMSRLQSEAAVTTREKSSRFRWLGPAIICLLLLVPLFRVIQNQSQVIPPNSTTTDKITEEMATILLCEQSVWPAGQNWQEGTSLSAQTLHLLDGFALLRFAGGAEMVLQGEVKIELLSPGSARLLQGDVVIRAPEEAAGFTLLTPASELRDLGTEFSVRVDTAGTTELDVLEGEVAVLPLNAANNHQPRILTADQAISIDNNNAATREIPVKSQRFHTLVQQADPPVRWELTHAYEGFYYDAGQLPLAESLKGQGWRGPWRQRTIAEGFRAEDDTTDDLEIVNGQMNVAWPVPGGRHGMLRMPPGQYFRLRPLKRPIDLAANELYYISFMLHVTPEKQFHKHDDFRLTFRNSTDYYGQSISFGVPRSKGVKIQTGMGVGFRSISAPPSDQSLFCIAKVIARQNQPDEIRFRIYGEQDELGVIEPREWDVVARDVDLSAAFDLCVITSVGHSERILDELRIGPTWRSVALVMKPHPAQEKVETQPLPE